MNWLTDNSGKIAFGVPFKNGCNSIRKALNGNQDAVRINWHYMKKNFPHMVFVVRHPVERFKSLWRSKCRDHESGPGVERLGKEELFARIQAGPVDEHWQRQVELIAEFPDAELVRLEDMPAWWSENMGGDYPHEHITKPDDDFAPDLVARVLEYYADDVRLYNGA